MIAHRHFRRAGPSTIAIADRCCPGRPLLVQRVSTALTALTNSSQENGFAGVRQAPKSLALCRRFSFDTLIPSPAMVMIFTWGSSWCKARMVSSPSFPGIRISVSTTSGARARKSWSLVSPSGASSTSWPFSSNTSRGTARHSASSSITSTRAMPPP